MSRVITIDYPEALTMAVEGLQAGGLVVLPTDTVYGVGCLLKAPAIDRVFSAKRRTPEKAIPVLLASIDNVHQVVSDFSEPARRLAEAFWPGPLTLVLPKRADLPENLTTLDTVGVRVPDHAATRAIIAAAGGVLAGAGQVQHHPRAERRHPDVPRWRPRRPAERPDADRRLLLRRDRAPGADLRGRFARGPGITSIPPENRSYARARALVPGRSLCRARATPAVIFDRLHVTIEMLWSLRESERAAFIVIAAGFGRGEQRKSTDEFREVDDAVRAAGRVG